MDGEESEFDGIVESLHEKLRHACRYVKQSTNKKEKRQIDRDIIDKYAAVVKENQSMRLQNTNLKAKVDRLRMRKTEVINKLQNIVEQRLSVDAQIQALEAEISAINKYSNFSEKSPLIEEIARYAKKQPIIVDQGEVYLEERLENEMDIRAGGFPVEQMGKIIISSITTKANGNRSKSAMGVLKTQTFKYEFEE